MEENIINLINRLNVSIDELTKALERKTKFPFYVFNDDKTDRKAVESLLKKLAKQSCPGAVIPLSQAEWDVFKKFQRVG